MILIVAVTVFLAAGSLLAVVAMKKRKAKEEAAAATQQAPSPAAKDAAKARYSMGSESTAFRPRRDAPTARTNAQA
jgi:flagellar basal body-associated protein FliL